MPPGKSKKRDDYYRDRRRRKVCAFCADKTVQIDYKEVNRLRRYLSERATLGKTTRGLAEFLAVPDERRTFENTPRQLDRLLATMEEEAAPLAVLRHVSPSAAIRAAGEDCNARVVKLSIEILSRDDVQRALRVYDGRKEPLGAEDARLAEMLLADIRRQGALLSSEDKARVRLLMRTLVDYELAYRQNHIEANDVVSFSSAELTGLGEGVVQFRRRPDGLLEAPADAVTFNAVMSRCANPETRRRMELVFNNRTYPDNLAIQEAVFTARRSLARLLGYPSYAQFVLESRMARTPDAVRSFLERLRRKLTPQGGRHVAALLELKRTQEPGAERIEAWDVRYYENLLRSRFSSRGATDISDYLPLDGVLRNLLRVSGTVFGLRFRQVRPQGAWHPSVRLVEAADVATGRILGRVYLDLHARAGKIKTYADYPLMSNRSDPSQPCRIASTVLVANFAQPKKGILLLSHADLAILLHLFGHALHHIAAAPRHARFAVPRVVEDFADVPAKVLEHWAWDAGALQALSTHRETGAPLPEAAAQGIARSRASAGILSQLSWVAQSLFDLDVHSHEVADVSGHNRRLVDEIALVPQSSGTHPELKYSVIKGGQGVRLYVTRWADVIAMDIVSRMKSGGLLDPAEGGRFRRLILEPGGSQDADRLVRDFLGRDPSEDAFVQAFEQDS